MRMSEKDRIDYLIFKLLSDKHKDIWVLFDSNEEAIELMDKVLLGLEKLTIILGAEIANLKKSTKEG